MIQMELLYWFTVVFLILYPPRLLCWLAPLRKQARIHNDKQNRLAVIIPARNEGKAVLPLFDSIISQNYPKERFHTFVVVKEKNDPVREYAANIGATTYVDETQTCKGDCLDYALRSILNEYPDQYDAFIIVDADCILDKGFLTEMNNAMATDAQVINAKKIVKNYYKDPEKNSNMVTACNGIIWTLMDEMGNRFKSEHGYTTMTVSTGLLIRSNLVKKWNGWIYNKTLTEDMELQRDCGLQNYKTYYDSNALIYMEESPSHTETNKRRTRWMSGLIDSDKLYYRKLLQKSGMRELVNNYYLLCLWIPYIYIGGLAAGVMINLVGAIIGVIWDAALTASCIQMALIQFGIIYFCFFVMTLFAIVIDHKYIKLSFIKKIELLFVHPLFYMEYIKIVFNAIRGQEPKEWEEIERVGVR